MARRKQEAELEGAKATDSHQAPADERPAQPPASQGSAAEPHQAGQQQQYEAVRSWTKRYAQPVSYEKLTDNTLKKIIFRFDLPKGQATPPEEALEVMRSHKQAPDGRPTGLRFEHTRTHGKVWTLPNDAEGRALADRIDMELNGVAKKLETGQQPGGR